MIMITIISSGLCGILARSHTERQESLQSIADFYFNVEVGKLWNTRELANYDGFVPRR